MTRPPVHARREGIACILAMFILVIFASLAVAHMSAVQSSFQQAQNQNAVTSARLEAESGLQFATWVLRQTQLPRGLSGQAMLDALAAALQASLEGTANLAGQSVAYDGTAITVPYIATGSTSREFAMAFSLADASTIHVRVTGKNGPITRTVGANFAGTPTGSGFFAYGVASRSRVVMTGNASVTGLNRASEANVLSTTASTNTAFNLTGNTAVAGDLYMTNPSGQVALTGNPSIGGTSVPAQMQQHVHIGVDPVAFPEVDPSVFAPFATNNVTASTNTSGNKTFENIRIKANANPTFSGNIVLRGVIYIEKPNKVTFAGNLNLTGVIVTEDAGDNQYNTNYITFTGNTTSSGVESLPAGAQWDVLRTMTGSQILAPGFGVKFTGNFGTVNGTMAADKFTFTGNSGGTIRGMLVCYSDSDFTFTGNSQLIIDRSRDKCQPPAGFAVPSVMVPKSGSYVEY